MASPKNTELLRRTLLQTSSVYVRFQPKEEGWEGVIEDSKGKVATILDKNIEVVAETANTHILSNRKPTPGKKKEFAFNQREEV